MLKSFLNLIEDQGDYIAALALLRKDGALTAEEAGRLVRLYEKYVPEAADPDYVRCCLAVYLLPGRTRADAADFRHLGLTEGELEALFTAASITRGEGLTVEQAQDAAALAADGALSVPVRVLLARIALDEMADSPYFVDMRPQIDALAAFLTQCGAEVLERLTMLVREVKLKCRR